MQSLGFSTFEVGSPRVFKVRRSATPENQPTFMCYPPVNTVYDEEMYFEVIVAGEKKTPPALTYL